MSISSLRSEIASQQRENSALRSKVRAVEAENAAIQNEINQMCNAISSATNSLLDIEHRATSSLSNDRKIMGNSYNVLVDAINIQDDIKEKYLRYKVIERVYKEIHALNNDIRYNLFMYATAKKIAHAFIDNLSFKVISDETTYKDVESLELQARDYYLTNVLLYIVLMDTDRPEAADRALKLALGQDKNNATRVLFLYYYLKKDYETAEKWLDEVKKNGITDAQGEKILLLAYLSDFCDKYKTGRRSLDEKLHDIWVEFAGKDQKNQTDIEQAIYDDYFNKAVNTLYDVDKVDSYYVMGHRDKLVKYTTNDGTLYKLISKYVVENERMFAAFALANGNANIYEDIKMYGEDEFVSRHGNFVKSLIDDYIDTVNPAILQDKLDRIEEKEAVIFCKGDEAEAKRMIAMKRKKKDENHSGDDKLFDWLLSDMSFVGKHELIQHAFIALKAYFEAAYIKYRNNYLKMMPKEVNVTIDDYTCLTSFDDMEKEKDDISNHYKEIKEARIKKEIHYFVCPIIGVVALALLILGCVFLSNVVGSVFCFIGAAAGLAGGVWLFYSYHKKANKIVEECALNTMNTMSKFIELAAEYKAFKKLFEESDTCASRIREMLKTRDYDDVESVSYEEYDPNEYVQEEQEEREEQAEQGPEPEFGEEGEGFGDIVFEDIDYTDVTTEEFVEDEVSAENDDEVYEESEETEVEDETDEEETVEEEEESYEEDFAEEDESDEGINEEDESEEELTDDVAADEDGTNNDNGPLYDVIIDSTGANKLGVVRAIMDITGMGVIDVKALVDSAPQPVKQGISKDEAEKISATLKGLGAKTEVFEI